MNAACPISISAIRRAVLATAAIAAIAAPGLSQAQDKISDGVVKIGLLNDMSGVYADIVGPGAVIAAKMAIADFGGKVHGKPIELVVADTQNKADITAAKAREWFDTQKVDMLGDVAATAPALAALQVAKQKNKIALFPSAASSRLSNEDCSAISVHWTYDTYALAAGTGRCVNDPSDVRLGPARVATGRPGHRRLQRHTGRSTSTR